MAQRETREEAQERILALQAERMARLEANPKYQELDPLSQDTVANMVMPHMFDPKYEISRLLSSIQVCKSLIAHANKFAVQSPNNSELCAEVIEGERWCIQQDLIEIKRIQRGDFEWVI